MALLEDRFTYDRVAKLAPVVVDYGEKHPFPDITPMDKAGGHDLRVRTIRDSIVESHDCVRHKVMRSKYLLAEGAGIRVRLFRLPGPRATAQGGDVGARTRCCGRMEISPT